MKIEIIYFKGSYNPDEVGSEGCGYIWKTEEDSDYEDDKELTDIWGNENHYDICLGVNVILRECIQKKNYIGKFKLIC